MPITGWAPYEFATGTTAQSYDLGHKVNRIILKNTDASIRIWFSLSEFPETVVASSTPGIAIRAYPLDAGESIEYVGIRCRYVNTIAVSGNPVMKVSGYLSDPPVRSKRKM